MTFPTSKNENAGIDASANYVVEKITKILHTLIQHQKQILHIQGDEVLPIEENEKRNYTTKILLVGVMIMECDLPNAPIVSESIVQPCHVATLKVNLN
jgi:hypothetical protein